MSSGQSPPESTVNTRLGRALEGAADSHPGQAGFLAVSDGIDALAIRLLLADRAERSIDTQYYEIGDDLAGLLFIEALLRAADRGVHVKLLVDDYQTRAMTLGWRPWIPTRISRSDSTIPSHGAEPGSSTY